MTARWGDMEGWRSPICARITRIAIRHALMKIEGFRSLNEDIKTIINKSEAVKKAKKESTEKLTSKEKNELSEEEKEYKSKRKQIQEN